MRYFPVFLDLTNRPCLVVGVGALADEKAQALEKAGALVTRQEAFDPGRSVGFFLIVAALENPQAARAVQEFGDRHRVFVNVVDQTERCTFISPAVVDRGNLLIAVSTCGKSPALASSIRRELESRYGPEYSEALDLLGQVRPLVKESLPSFEERKAFYAQLVECNLPGILRAQGVEAVRRLIQEKLREVA